MSYRTGPKIVTDGLVCCLDAADRNSYNGSGSWKDLTGNTTINLYYSPTFITANCGGFDFDGTNDFAGIVNLQNYMSSSPGTLSVWFSPDVIDEPNTYLLMGVGSYTNRYYIQYDNANATVFRGNPAAGGVVGECQVGGFYNVVSAYTSDMLYGYFNGELTVETSYTNSGSFSLTNIGYQSGTGTHFNGKIFLIQIYNRLLSSDEVTQNFEATKGRFGL